MHTPATRSDEVDQALLEAYRTSFLHAIHETIATWVRAQPDGVELPWGELMRAGLLWEVAITIRHDVSQGWDETEILSDIVERLADAILAQRGMGETGVDG